MAIKQVLILKDEILNQKYTITGQSGIYKQEDYEYEESRYLTKPTERFILIDLWAFGTFGAESCKSTWNEEEEIHIIKEEDIDDYIEDTIEYINDNLATTIKDYILAEIEGDEEETVKLIR